MYAHARDATLVTFDKEFSERRRKNTIGRHVWLRCPETGAAEILRSNLNQVLSHLQISNVIIIVSSGGVQAESSWE